MINETILRRIEEEEVLQSHSLEPLVTIIRQQQEIIERLTRKGKVEEYVLKVKLLSEKAQLPQ